MKNIAKIALISLLAAALVSCNPNTWKKIVYLQDVTEDSSVPMEVNTGLIIQPQDQISIIVSARDPKLAAQFNLSVSNFQTGTELGMGGGGTQRITGYIVDNDGNINFPGLGKVHVAGLNRWALQDFIRTELEDKGLLRDAVVTVEFMNIKISVLGEVTSPGTYSVTGDKITIFGALALARDLTIHGRRDAVKVLREKNGVRELYVLDLRDSEIFNSPAYYLQQNDVVYVDPSKVRAGQSTINENYFKSGAFWISLASISMTTVSFIITLINTAKSNK
ncbi:MAG: polysaccharide biosynthesis/export family protein [Bacteroidales bacterium]|nr:polysaccharide biosynthesis/export family protein [Bacteroidales bacterium]